MQAFPNGSTPPPIHVAGASANGRGGPSRNGSTPPPSPDEEQTPKTWAERWAAWRKQSRATLAGVPRAFGLVWESHRGYTVSMAVLSVLFGIIPTATAWVGK